MLHLRKSKIYNADVLPHIIRNNEILVIFTTDINAGTTSELLTFGALLEKPDKNWLHFGYNRNATKTSDTNWLHFGYNQNVTKMQPKRPTQIGYILVITKM